MIVASGLSLKLQVAGYHKLLLINPGLYNFVEVLRRLINRGAYTRNPCLYPRGVITGTEKAL